MGGPTLGTDTRKEGDRHTRNPHPKGDIGQLGRESGKRAASGKRPRKEAKRVSGVGTLGATKNPAGVNLRGGVGVIGLPSVTGKGGQDEKEGEQQAQGEVT